MATITCRRQELGDPFDYEMSAWTYRKVNETDLFPAGYAPLGVAGGLAKQQAKLDLLWQELERRNIPLSVVIYPHLGQLVHDTAENRQVQILRQWCEGKCKRFVVGASGFLCGEGAMPAQRAGLLVPELFVFGDIHFGPAGNALVADAVIQSLTQDPPASSNQLRALTETLLGSGDESVVPQRTSRVSLEGAEWRIDSVATD